MAKDTGRIAFSSLCTECSRRGPLWRSDDHQSCACSSPANEITPEEEVASGQEIVHANHLSHTGRFARVHGRAEHSGNQIFTCDLSRGFVGIMDSLSGCSRPDRNGAGASPRTHQYFYWKRKFTIYGGTRKPSHVGNGNLDRPRRKWWLRKLKAASSTDKRFGKDRATGDTSTRQIAICEQYLRNEGVGVSNAS